MNTTSASGTGLLRSALGAFRCVGRTAPAGTVMLRFLQQNHEALIERCKAIGAHRSRPAATDKELRNGIPQFLEQLEKTLHAEAGRDAGESFRISGAAGGGAPAMTEIGLSATVHGRQLLELGYTVDQVVHGYGDICQAITGLAAERHAPFTIEEFRTLNRCLDNAIAGAVTEFSAQRELGLSRDRSAHVNERVGSMVHELRNSLHAAALAVRALESGNLPLQGATGGVLKRSLAAMTSILLESEATVRATASTDPPAEIFSVASLVADAAAAASLDALGRGCLFTADAVDGGLAVRGSRRLLLGAVMNLLQNGFKFTAPGSHVRLGAHAGGEHVLIEVSDHCGGLPAGWAEKMFKAFGQAGGDRTGLGLGLSIARRNVEADGGSLSVRDVPGTGCVFTISLPAHAPEPASL
jgi:signal transduction histidine kinase